jgi:hypothetical protein
MVIGLDRFAEHFAEYKDHYILIGGAATWLVLDEAGIEPRATKDLDIVLCVEVLNAAFGKAFWEFVRNGRYAIQEKSEGPKVFYRFKKPEAEGFPEMLELFSRQPEGMSLGDDSHLTPIPLGEDVSSLSAILLDDNYYDFIHRHKREIEGVSLVGEECLIPLKARAWLDLTQRKYEGKHVDSKDIKKHRSDVLRLYLVMDPGRRFDLPETVREDLAKFLEAIEPELNSQLLKQIGIQGVGSAEILRTLREVYGIDQG